MAQIFAFNSMTCTQIGGRKMISANELAHLPTSEKIRIVTELWDQIASHPEPFDLPEWILDEAERRLDRIERDLDAGLTEEQIWRRADEAR